jgi:hemerythrin-like metal-binding protein
VQPFNWNKRHAVFIPEIDAEHRNIFRLADELRQAVVDGAPADQAQAILRELMARGEDHFAHEERLMRSTHYPASAWHKRQHDTVRKRLKEFAPRIEEGEGQAAPLLLEFLFGWLRDHVRLADCMMAAHVRNYERVQAVLAS